MALSLDEVDRYHRQLILAGWGDGGQERVAAASVTVRGRGPAARAAARYLVGAGVARVRCQAEGDEAAALAALNPGVELSGCEPPGDGDAVVVEAAGALLRADEDRAALGAALAGEALKALLGLPFQTGPVLPSLAAGGPAE